MDGVGKEGGHTPTGHEVARGKRGNFVYSRVHVWKLNISKILFVSALNVA